VPDDLAPRVGMLLERAALGLLSLANKAGKVVHGFEKVSQAIAKGKVEVLIEASDGAEDGREKLQCRLKSALPGAQTVVAFDQASLGLALGRPYVVHAALSGNGLTSRFLAAARRLEAYRDHPVVQGGVGE
jgi:ribosomal protein L7Ae-like RNA K-turn-binding protein